MLASGSRAALAPRASARARAPRRPAPRAHRVSRPRRLARVSAAPEGGEDADASTTRVTTDENDELLDTENQPSFSNRWSGSDDEDDSYAAAHAARVAAASHGQAWDSRPDGVHPEREPHPPRDTGTAPDPKTYSDEEIAAMQVDALRHAAVVDSVTARLDREEHQKASYSTSSTSSPVRYNAPTTHFPAHRDSEIPTPEFSSPRQGLNEEARRPPHVAVPADAKSKACVCRYTYDRNVLDHLGEEYVLERYDPLETAALHDGPNAAIEDLVPVSVRRACACRGADDAFARVILAQGFDWTSAKRFHPREAREDAMSYWRWLDERASAIASLGVTHLWLPPPSQSASPEGYLPGRLFQLDSWYGSKEDLVALCASLKKQGVTPVCDVVINHRTADAVGKEGAWNVYADLDQDGEPVHWGQWAITCDDPLFHGKGGPDSGENYGPAPDLDHANPDLRFTLKRWLVWLRDEIGFGGFRFDFVRGFAPEYVEEYIKSAFPPETRRVEPRRKKEKKTGTEENLNPVDVVFPNPVFHVGENWVDMHWEGSSLSYDQDGPRSRLVDWIEETHGSCALFDFPTKGILQRAVEHAEFWRLRDAAARPPGLLGWVPTRAVTFLENHDTGPPQNHWPFPTDRLELGYAYVLTHPGIPCVFGPHFWGSEFGNDEEALLSEKEAFGEKTPSLSLAEEIYSAEEMSSSEEISSSERGLGSVISRLVALRKKHDIRADAHVKILAAENDLYVARVAHRLTVKLGPRYDVPSALLPREPEWALALSGDDWAVWERQPEYVRSDYDDASSSSFVNDQDDATARDEKRTAAEVVRKVCGVTRATDEDAVVFDANAPLFLGGALDASDDPASVGSFFEAPTSGCVEPAASWDEDEDEDEDDLTSTNPR